MRFYSMSSYPIMTYFATLSRKLLKVKIFIVCIAVYALVLIFTSLTGIEFFHGKPKETEFKNNVLDVHDLHRMERIKQSLLREESHEFKNSAQAESSERAIMNKGQIEKEEKEKIIPNAQQGRRKIVANKSLPSLGNEKANIRRLLHASCKEKRILKKYKINARENVACTPHILSAEACRFTKEAYKIDKRLQICRDNNTYVYCYLKHGNSLEFECRNLEMYRYCKISVLDWTTGDLKVIRNFVDSTKLELHLKFFAKVEIERKSNFLFVECFLNSDSRLSDTQLILLPFKLKEKTTSRRKDKVSLNIVLLDSISRAHFYRSLPVVLQTFDDINSDVNSEAEVLDFELFQAVHGHSAENFHAFFTGALLPRNMTESEREQSNVGVGNLYGILKGIGYETMYQDDLCWKYWWGIRMELGMAANWRELRRKIRTSNIDYTGITFASCKILALNNLNTPFNGPDNSQICLNGRFHHSYIFEHLLQYFQRRENSKPRISFTTINTGHDYKGVRAQTLNVDLSNMVRKLATLENTLTILMADHGNTYTTYASTMLEGRYEMHHPSLFMILPESVKERLGTSALANLRRNTKRLFTMLDVHKTILDIAVGSSYKMRKSGDKSHGISLLRHLPASRHCNDLDLAMPNLCICEGWDTPAKNDTSHIGSLEFAVGVLNNLIDSGRREGWRNKLKKQWNCNRLYAKSFRNVRERIEKGNLITTMDFVTDPGRGSGHTEEVFHVELKATVAQGRRSRNMMLLSYDRLSQYGIYRQCKDPGVNAKLCICSLKRSEKHDSHDMLLEDGSFNIYALLRNQPRLHGVFSEIKIQDSLESYCTYLYTRDFKDHTSSDVDNSYATVVEIINICTHGNGYLHLDIETKNCQASRNFPLRIKTEAQSITFVAVIIRTVSYWPSSFRIIALPDLE